MTRRSLAYAVLIALGGMLAIMICPVRGMTPEARKSWDALAARAAAGDSDAQWRMGSVLERGYDSIEADTVTALSLFRMAAAKGHPEAANYLGYLFGHGKYVKADNDSARYWITAAAEAGSPKAAYNLGLMLLPDTAARYWIEKSAQSGLPSALVLLGDITARGDAGIKADSLQAVKLYDAALEKGYLQAESHLLTLTGPSIAASPAPIALRQARRYDFLKAWTLAADYLLAIPDTTPEAPEALRRLGVAYAHGRGVDYDYAKANDYFRRAAALGDSVSMRIVEETLQLFPDFL